MADSKIFEVTFTNNVSNVTLTQTVLSTDVEAACLKVRTALEWQPAPFMTISQVTPIRSIDIP